MKITTCFYNLIHDSQMEACIIFYSVEYNTYIGVCTHMIESSYYVSPEMSRKFLQGTGSKRRKPSLNEHYYLYMYTPSYSIRSLWTRMYSHHKDIILFQILLRFIYFTGNTPPSVGTSSLLRRVLVELSASQLLRSLRL